MAGPFDPKLAPQGAQGGQYVTVPAFAAPGHSSPSNTRDAPGSTIVYSPKGWRWEEAGDDYSKTISKLTAATMEGAVRRVKTSMGEVFYIRGTSDTVPPFKGVTVGDTCRVQDAQTLDIVAEWRWNGASWERMRVTSEQISNLDVGKLTAGSASIAEIAARKIAADVGRFLHITTDQLTVTGNASFVNATAHHIWSRIVTAGQGEFEQIKAGMIAANAISASNIQAGAIDGQVITGATFQTNKTPSHGIKINNNGMRVYSRSGTETLTIDPGGNITINGRIGRRDTWSECFFDDLVWAQTGTDISSSGAKIGCGLAFNSLEDNWEDGALFIQKDPHTSEPAITLQSAAKKGAPARPSLTVGTQQVSITIGPQADWGTLAMNKYGFSSRVNSASFVYNDGEISYRKVNDNGHAYFGLGNDWATLTCLTNKNTGLWVNNRATVLAWRKYPQIWLDNDGIHMNPEKKFTMRVPKLSKERGGLWLSHACTESPYDGLEYWENLILDEAGHARWALPDYVPRIASPTAPWVALASGTAAAEIDRSDPVLWAVNVTGEPGARVGVLVKGARMVDTGADDADGEPVMRDNSRKSPWELGPPDVDDNDGALNNDMSLPGTYYGPAPKPTDWSNDSGSTEQPG